MVPPLSDLPLGQKVTYPSRYAPELLRPVPRAAARAELGLSAPLPFTGVDIWNAWELAWLDATGKPAVATATLYIDASSPNIVESKSLKLYLSSIAHTRVPDVRTLKSKIADDLRNIVKADVRIEVDELPQSGASTACLEGSALDNLDIHEIPERLSPAVLTSDRTQITQEALHSHLLRSLCPVTGQPDTGSVLIRYRGPTIDRAGLLAYLLSFRNHNDFHEACAERIFIDLMQRCDCEHLTVYLRYNRRGGIDINPFRSNFETDAKNTRLWRQ